MSRKDWDTMWNTGNKNTRLQRGFRIKKRKLRRKVRKHRQLLKHMYSCRRKWKKAEESGDMGRKVQRRGGKKRHKKVVCQKESNLSVKRMRCDHIKNQFWTCKRYAWTECKLAEGKAFIIIIIIINESIELFNFLAISSNSCSLQRMSERQSLSNMESHLYDNRQSKLQRYKIYYWDLW